MLSTTDLVRCRIGGETYAIERSSVASVHQAAELRRSETLIIGAALGFIPVSHSGDVPVMRLADRLNSFEASLDESASGRGHIVVLRSSLGLQGFLVDSVSRVVPVPVDQVCPVPEVLNDPTRRVFKAVVLFREEGQADLLCLLLSPERLHRDAPPLPNERRLGIPARPKVDQSKKTGKSAHPTRLVVFPISEHQPAGRALLCGLSASQIVEIVERRPIIRTPLAPPDIAGFILWRDQAVPVVKVGVSVGIGDEPSSDRLIVVRHQGELFALAASQFVQSRQLPLPHQPCTTPREWNSAAVRGAFQSNDEWIVFPNLSWRSQLPAASGSVAVT